MFSDETAKLLVDVAHDFYGRGWMVGTSGNLSIRTNVDGEPLRMSVTASGADKGALTVEDILCCGDDYESNTWGDKRPSAETSIHRAIYSKLPGARCILHVHTVVSTCLSLTVRPQDGLSTIRFVDYEMIKGLGLWDVDAVAVLPVFPNWASVTNIAADVAEYLREPPLVPGFLIRGHGLTAWGNNVSSARKHLEVLEFLCACAWETCRLERL